MYTWYLPTHHGVCWSLFPFTYRMTTCFIVENAKSSLNQIIPGWLSFFLWECGFLYLTQNDRCLAGPRQYIPSVKAQLTGCRSCIDPLGPAWAGFASSIIPYQTICDTAPLELKLLVCSCYLGLRTHFLLTEIVAWNCGHSCDWLRETRDPCFNIQLQPSFFKPKDSFMYPRQDCAISHWHSFDFFWREVHKTQKLEPLWKSDT